MPTWKILFGKPCKDYSIELFHYITQGLKDTTHDTIAPAVYLYTQFVMWGTFHKAYIIYLDKTILKGQPLLDFVKVR